jgi:two-component system chemotaxis response regulator CheY
MRGLMGGGRILLIDDDEQFRKLVTVMLTTAGYGLQEASNGTEGLAAYRLQRADVVLMDILMPEKEGIESIAELTHIDPHVKIIAMSSSGDGRLGHLRVALTLGAVRILHKPFTRDELLSAIAQVIALPETDPQPS